MAGDLKYNVSCCFDVKITDNSGYILSADRASNIIREFETNTTCKFSSYKSRSTFGKTGNVNIEYFAIHLLCTSVGVSIFLIRLIYVILCEDFRKSKHRIHWEDTKSTKDGLKFDGVPFMILDTMLLDCQHGSDRHVAAKKKRASKTVSAVILLFFLPLCGLVTPLANVQVK